FCDVAVLVVDVTEGDRARRARGLASGHDLAVADPAILALGGDAREADPLHAIGAFLHDAYRANADVRIEEQPHARRAGIERADGLRAIAIEVEAPHLVGAVVLAITRTDAAVV